MLIHIIVLNQEIRQILVSNYNAKISNEHFCNMAGSLQVDVTQPVRSVIRDICATYGKRNNN